MSKQDGEHDLRDNDLLFTLTHLKEWHERNRETINLVLMGVLVVLLVVAVIRWQRVNAEIADHRAWSDLASASSPDSLSGVAVSHPDQPVVAALAHLRAGDLRLRDAALPEPPATPPDASDPNATDEPIGPTLGPQTLTRAEKLERARASYEQALAVKDAPKVIRLNARLGLAAAAEAEKNLEVAAKQYDLVIEEGGGYPALVGRAEVRRKMIGRLRDPIIFAPPATQPATTQPANGDSSDEPESEPSAPGDGGS